MNTRALKNALKPLANTPFHPQWLLGRGGNKIQQYIKAIGNHKLVLDVGCFNKWPSHLLTPDCRYVGLDYYETATEWYGTVPDVFGDACNLPVRSAVVDVVLLLDVIEHLPSPDKVLEEVCRVLKPGGSLILQMPFLYPLHDEPRDFSRLSHYGFGVLAERHGLQVEACHAEGTPIETAALLANIAITKIAMEWVFEKSPAMIFSLFVPILILAINLFAKAVARMSGNSGFMPYSYQILAKKPS